jgi:Flp pilus assembly protein TadG
MGVMLPLVLLLVIGVVEVTAAFNSYISVVSSARDGARLGSKGAASDSEIQALVVRDLERLPNDTPTSNVTVSHITLDSSSALRVRACYDHNTLIGVPLVIPNTFRMCSETTMPELFSD